MKCPECGATIGDEEKFCGECGAPIEQAPEVPVEEPGITSSEETVYAAPAVAVESNPLPDEMPASEPVIPSEPMPPAQEPDFAPPPPFTPPPQSAGFAPPPVTPVAPPAKGKSNTGLIIAIAVVVLLLLCCCCAVAIVVFLSSNAGQDILYELGISAVLPALSAML